jgi:hypothetical protein
MMTKPCKNRAFLFHYILIKVPEWINIYHSFCKNGIQFGIPIEVLGFLFVGWCVDLGVGNKIFQARRWLRERTLFEKVIIHIGLFPLPALFILISYSKNNLNDN